MVDGQQLSLGKNYFSYQANDAETSLQQFMGSIGEIKDMCMLPSRIQMEPDEAIACLPTTITMKVKFELTILTILKHVPEEMLNFLKQFLVCLPFNLALMKYNTVVFGLITNKFVPSQLVYH